MQKKIILIGPVYPYKGGISHYTGLMYRELAKRHDVEMISYKMQYPKILFHKEQRDYSNDSFKIENTEYMLHTANPFNIIKTANYIRRQSPDLVVIQWWHPYFAPCYFLLARFMGKQNVVFVCHNVFPHERFPLDRFLTRLALNNGSHFIVHAAEEAKELEKIKPDPDYVVTPHPTYNAFCFEKMSKGQAQKKLDIASDEKILLFFGYVREYKGLKYLFRAMPAICKADDKVRLWVVGEFGADREEYRGLIEELEIAEYVRVVDSYTPDREVEQYFAAADLVVVPYVSATQSGIVQIAYGFTKPVIVTEVGGLPDVVEDGRTGYVVKPESPEAIAEAALKFFREEQAECMRGNIEKEAYRFSWERMGEVVEKFMQD
ncbi:MAG: glycosyltransferase [Lachnospiraceae bacterium]|nr:glycosyltransferase [Lachnospiraceae bacterium]MDE7179337.1 glycosyltransferase [Lachnospiraceae bacterium]